MKYSIFTTAVLAVASIGFATTALPDRAYAVSIFLDKSAWQDALGGMPFTTDLFSRNDRELNDFDFISESGAGQIINGKYSDIVDNSPRLSTTFTLKEPLPLKAFGGNWDLSPAGPGVGIDLVLANGTTESVSPAIDNSFTGEFFGVVSENPFSKIILTGGNQPGRMETFTLENVVYSRVPEPLTILGSVAAVGFGIAMKKKLASFQKT